MLSSPNLSSSVDDTTATPEFWSPGTGALGRGRLGATLSERVTEQIARSITSGHYGTGQRLIVSTIASELGVSATPVREAIAVLAKEGLVQTEPRKGAVVVPYSVDDVASMYLCRAYVYGLAAKLAARATVPQALDEPAEHLRRMHAAVKLRDTNMYIAYDLAFYTSLANASGSGTVQTLLRSLGRTVLHPGITAIFTPGRLSRSIRGHELLMTELRRGDGGAAEVCVRELVADAFDSVMQSFGANHSRIDLRALMSLDGTPALK